MVVMTDVGPLILFRTDASPTIGSGHLMRCLTLAAELKRRNARIVFVTRELPRYLNERMRQARHRHIVIDDGEAAGTADADATLLVFERLREVPRWVVIDHYGLGAAWETAVNAAGSSVLAVDDLANREHLAEVLLDQNLVSDMEGRYVGLIPATTMTLLGPRFALLQPDYGNARANISRGKSVKRVLAYFGAADNNLTTLAAAAHIQNSLPETTLDLVLDEANGQFAALRALSTSQPSIVLHRPMSSLARLMAAADLFIGAGGATSWERLCLGLPSIIVTMADNQVPIAAELHRRGFATWLGESGSVTVGTMARAVARSLAEEAPKERVAAMMQSVDGLGVKRVCDVLHLAQGAELRCRNVCQNDKNLLLAWANDRGTRRYAFQQQTINSIEHAAWFAKRLENPDIDFFIIESPFGIPAGHVRFERDHQQTWAISYLLAPTFRGRGLGQRLLKAGLDVFATRHPEASTFGFVKPKNSASVSIFRALGFEESLDDTRGNLIFRRSAI